MIILLLTTFISVCAQSINPVVIAHRGNHSHAPENTLRAFRDAIAVGVDYVEVDLRTTQDGVLIVMHDETINRMTASQGRVRELSWNSLRNLEVADKRYPENGTDRIPTFREVLELCKGKVKVYLDFKDADVEATMKIVHELNMEKEIAVYINSLEHYKSWRAIAPEIPLISSLPSYKVEDAIQFLTVNPVEILDGRVTSYTRELVALVHKRNLLIWVDVQQASETPALWKAAADMHYDGLQTDHPEELIAYLKEQHLR